MNHLKSKASSLLGLEAVSNVDQQSFKMFKHVRSFGVFGDDPIEQAPDVHFEERVEEFCKERGIPLADAYLLGLDIRSDHIGTAVLNFLHPGSVERNWQINHVNESRQPKKSHLFGNQFSNMCIRENIAGVVVGHVPGNDAFNRMESFRKEILTDHWARGLPYMTQNESFTSKEAWFFIQNAFSSPSHMAESGIKDWEMVCKNALKNNQSAVLILQSYQILRERRESLRG